MNTKRNEVYVVNTGSNSVSVIDAEKNAVVATIHVHQRPYFVSVSADGTRAYVANSGSNNVSVIDLKLRREIAAIGVGEGPGVAAISPDGNTLVVSNRVGNSVSIVDAKTYQVRSVWSGCPGATDIAILPDSSKAFIACSSGHQVMAIALATPPPLSARARRSTTQPTPKDALLALLDVGKTPIRLVLKPDGGEIFAVNYDDASISEIDTSTNEVGGAYMVGTHPVAGLATADNSTHVHQRLRCRFAGRLQHRRWSAYSGNAPRTGDGPDAMAFSKAGHLLFVVDARSGDVAVIRTSTNSLLTCFRSAGSRTTSQSKRSWYLQHHSL